MHQQSIEDILVSSTNSLVALVAPIRSVPTT